MSETKPIKKKRASDTDNYDRDNNQPQLNRYDIYESAKNKYNELIKKKFPIEVSGIKVVDFGVINYENSSFHNPIEVYPIGYKALVDIPFAPPTRGRTDMRPMQVRYLYIYV